MKLLYNIAPGEGQSPVSFISEPNWEALAILKDYCVGRNDFNVEKDLVTLSKICTSQTEMS